YGRLRITCPVWPTLGPINIFGEPTLGPKFSSRAHFGLEIFVFGFPASRAWRDERLPIHDRNRAPTGIGALPSLQSLVAVLSDAVLPERRKPRGVGRGFPRIGFGSAHKREPVRMKQARPETDSWM